MKVLIISRDQDLFNERSEAFKEVMRLSREVEQIHVIVFTLKKERFEIKNLSNTVFIYPTNSRTSIDYVLDAISVAQRQVLFSKILIVDLIVAMNPFLTAAVAYILALRYKKHFLVTVTDHIRSALKEESWLSRYVKKTVAEYVLPRASAIHVPTQTVGEILCLDFPVVENKIYILGRSSQSSGEVQEKKILDPRVQEFNVLLLTKVGEREDIKKLVALMRNLRIRYRRIGLVAIDADKLHKGRLGFSVKNDLPFIIWEKDERMFSSYLSHAQMYLDISRNTAPSSELIEAAFSGCPIVAAPSVGNKVVVYDEQNGFIADPNNLAEFSGRIAEILETPGLRQMMKMARYEVEQFNTKPTEEYETSLVGIWQKIVAQGEDLSPDSLQEYARSVTHSLKETRAYVQEVTTKLKEQAPRLKASVLPDFSKPKKREKPMTTLEDEGPLDVDIILK